MGRERLAGTKEYCKAQTGIFTTEAQRHRDTEMLLLIFDC